MPDVPTSKEKFRILSKTDANIKLATTFRRELGKVNKPVCGIWLLWWLGLRRESKPISPCRVTKSEALRSHWVHLAGDNENLGRTASLRMIDDDKPEKLQRDRPGFLQTNVRAGGVIKRHKAPTTWPLYRSSSPSSLSRPSTKCIV
ncbi:hypothetical protein QTP88_016989 [Uroleucon formosanum]